MHIPTERQHWTPKAKDSMHATAETQRFTGLTMQNRKPAKYSSALWNTTTAESCFQIIETHRKWQPTIGETNFKSIHKQQEKALMAFADCKHHNREPHVNPRKIVGTTTGAY